MAGPAEWLRLNGQLVAVPSVVCERRPAFDAALSRAAWDALAEPQRDHLRTLLPTFPGDDDGKEQEETLRRLFAGENFRFGNPLDQFFSLLHDGRLTDQIHSLRRLTAETRQRDAKVWQQNYMDNLLRELVTKRKQLLDAAVKTPPDAPITLPPAKKKCRRAVLEQRARKRYFRELELVRAEAGCPADELSPDENYPEGPPPVLSRKQQRHLTKLEATLGGEHVPVAATSSRLTTRGPHLVEHASPEDNPYQVAEARLGQLLKQHRKRRARGQSAALGQKTHTSFFSLLRDVLCSDPADRLAETSVYSAVTAWQRSPIAALNDWYGRESSWVEALGSALAFLSGEVRELQSQINLVPFLDHVRESGIYQWIGAGRDSDIHLESLCAYWLQRKDTISVKREPSGDGSGPPAALHPTSWTVVPSTPAEKDEYRQQERLRYQAPRRAFTYRLHGYRSTVGPVRSGRDSKAGRGHALLTADRPPGVTLLSLVRDAVARLPNGEGSRADVCELVRDSGFLVAGSGDQPVSAAVSSAMDRLQAEVDPCLRYDSHRKVWMYLHRHRTEAEFETLERQRQASCPRRRQAVKRSAPTPAVSAAGGVAAAATVVAVGAAPAGASLLKPRAGALTVVQPKFSAPAPVPPLALLANGKLIPIVNQPATVKAVDGRPRASLVVAPQRPVAAAAARVRPAAPAVAVQEAPRRPLLSRPAPVAVAPVASAAIAPQQVVQVS
ncbi:Nuclear factor related to kappa-B-binding protein [Amphibalanus amphitrite]|uniref:Nuclear factor related to kappa-B-binding protein n=1 Tax=Amphibalanus amphitrite TaxID=1232801 RepID=A0A6A4VDC8_AMPAM|nr:Nuclear factor related to kappa-B-binding protein [Amphibalanus amphitrite]